MSGTYISGSESISGTLSGLAGNTSEELSGDWSGNKCVYNRDISESEDGLWTTTI
jgi:hypothetical protein